MKQNKIYFLVPLMLFAGTMNAQNKSRPNIILIYADDLGYGDLSCYAAKGVKTPNIDKLSREGLLFRNAHSTASTSTPSRYSMLTGEYAFRREGTDVAAGNAAMIISPDTYTMADLFSSASYKTAVIGKWHLGLGSKTAEQDWNSSLDLSPRDLGFDYSYIMAATADRVPCVFIENERVADYDPNAPIFVSYDKPFDGEPLGRNNPELLTKLRHSHGHDMSIINGIGRIGYMKGGGKALWKDEEIATRIVEKAKDFIRKNKDEAFFLYLATNDIHVPRFPDPRFRGKSSMGLRGDVILQLDWTVGEIMKSLKDLDIDENTIIIFSSDNGPVVDDGYQDRAEELLGEHEPSGGLRSYKYSAFEGGTRIPLIIRWHGHIEPSSISNQLHSQIDWMASFADLLGVELPKRAARDSRNNLPSLLGKKGAKARAYVLEQAANRTISIRTPLWKYIEPSDGPKMITWGAKVETGYNKEEQLFNLKNDPKEKNNLAKKYPCITKKLRRILEQETGRSIKHF